ncbi:hypothetical protein [Streptomyces mangrovisoli]|uniref:Uncharacterized protein n=1 Tax=Streptomyces mangrovisoli TaxID=1428628 RepID=A0A1J4NVS2_9ACTN|nr:hypothetical protein [Streptomyces mangrovisoli]OIJ66178.1 hypothetical protein WN71_020065 [Streptomyces mangrovisoli]
MSAPTHTRPHPAKAAGVDIRLPWWALALPTLAFITLLALMLNASDAQAAGDPVVTHLLDRVQSLMGR